MSAVRAAIPFPLIGKDPIDLTIDGKARLQFRLNCKCKMYMYFFIPYAEATGDWGDSNSGVGLTIKNFDPQNATIPNYSRQSDHPIDKAVISACCGN